MSRTVQLSGLTQGIQRTREKGGADPNTLYDLENGYVTIDGAVNQRPGTVEDATLPAGTIGLMAYNRELLVFSTSVKTMPAGYRCEVIVHPFFPSVGLDYIWFASPFLGYPYVVAEFANGDVYHYWLQAANTWEASTGYQEGQIIVPTTQNGLAYKATRALPAYPTWQPGQAIVPGDRREPSEANGFYYLALGTSEAAGVGTPGGSPNPDGGSPGSPGGGVVAGATGALPGGYVGVPYSNVGAFGDPWRDTGAGRDGFRYVTGALWPGATISNRGQISEGETANDVMGTPLVAGSYNVEIAVDTQGVPVSSFGVVAIAAKPSHPVLDFSGRTLVGVSHTTATPAFTGVALNSAGILDCAGWTSGKVYFEVNVTALTSLLVGVHGAALNNKYVGPGRTGTIAHDITATGTYGVAYDTATGNLWVRNAGGWIGGGDPAAGTTPTLTGGPTTSTNGRLRAGLYGTATAQANFGNVAWTYALPAGFSAIAMPSVTVPAVWDAQTLGIGSKTTVGVDMSTGTSSWLGNMLAEVETFIRATFGKSSGKWQFEVTNPRRFADDERVGIAVAAFDRAAGMLGQAGTANSIGIRHPLFNDERLKIETCFGGVHTEYYHAWTGLIGTFTLACDFTAGTVAIYADGVLVRTITGVPAGTYFPAASGGVFVQSNLTSIGLSHPVATFSDWTTTL